MCFLPVMCALVARVVCVLSGGWGILSGEIACESSLFPAVPLVPCLCCRSWAPSLAPLLHWARAGEPEQSPQGWASASSPPPVLQGSAPGSESLLSVLHLASTRAASSQSRSGAAGRGRPHPDLSRCQGGPAARATGHVSTRQRRPARGPVEVSTRAEEEQGATGLTQCPKPSVRPAPPPGKAPGGSPGSPAVRPSAEDRQQHREVDQLFST